MQLVGLRGRIFARKGVWRSSASSVLSNLGIRIALLAVNFGTGIIVARSLGPAGRGEQAVMAMWPGLLATVGTLGIPTALNYHSRRQPGNAARLYMSSLLAVFTTGCLIALAGALSMPLILHGYDSQTIRTAQWLMVFAPETLVASVARAHLESRDQFSRSTLGLFYPSLTTLGALVILRVTNHITPLSAALSYIIPPAIQAVWVVSCLWRRAAFDAKHLLPDVRLLLPYGIRCYGADLIGAMSGQMDAVMIVAFLTPRQLGLYTVGISLSRILYVAYSSVTVILFSRASSLDKDAAIAMVARAARFTTIPVIASAIVFWFFAGVAVPLAYGPQFTPVLALLIFLLGDSILSGISTVLLQGFMTTGRPGVVTIAQGCWTAVAFGLLYVLVPRMSIEGAAIALCGASVVRLALVCCAYPVVLRRPVPNVVLNSSDVRYLWNSVGLSKLRQRLGMPAKARPSER